MAFNTRYGYFKYQLIHFGLSNTPVSFQVFINKILAKKLDIFIIIYPNNVFIYTKNQSQSHLNAVYWVLEQLLKYGVYVNLEKCSFHQDKFRFLGFVVSAKGI